MVNRVFWREIRDGGVRLVWRHDGLFESALGQVDKITWGFESQKNFGKFRVGGTFDNGRWTEIGVVDTLESGKRLLVERVRAGRILEDVDSLREAEWQLERVVGLPGKRAR